jgi:hypothetical protein
LIRDWSAVPDSPERIIPNPVQIHKRFGGDPVSICMDGRNYQKRLFIGGIDIQAAYRPDVDVILNLGENASKWFNDVGLGPDDRWVDKGEGQQGMNASEIAEESMWVVEYLKAGNRVLVHCSAGMNRSATICCGVLILMEC